MSSSGTRGEQKRGLVFPITTGISQKSLRGLDETSVLRRRVAELERRVVEGEASVAAAHKVIETVEDFLIEKGLHAEFSSFVEKSATNPTETGIPPEGSGKYGPAPHSGEGHGMA